MEEKYVHCVKALLLQDFVSVQLSQSTERLSLRFTNSNVLDTGQVVRLGSRTTGYGPHYRTKLRTALQLNATSVAITRSVAKLYAAARSGYEYGFSHVATASRT